MKRRVPGALLLGLVCLGLASCGTTRVTDTVRAASEMLLISQAIDFAIRDVDFSELQGKPVFLDTQYLDNTVDKGYLISTLRERLLAHGALLQEERPKATYIVEVRAGAVGTDKSSLLVGTPALSLPAVVPGVPSQIPEIALVKRTDQKGVAKIAVFAYNRITGRALWQSGDKEAISTLKDTWFFGAGPYSRGTIRRDGEFAGETLPSLPNPLNVFPDDSILPTSPSGNVEPTPATEKPKDGDKHQLGTGLFGFERPFFSGLWGSSGFFPKEREADAASPRREVAPTPRANQPDQANETNPPQPIVIPQVRPD